MSNILLRDVGVDFMLTGNKSITIGEAVKKMAVGGSLHHAHGHLSVSALSGISTEVKDGDRLGLIGPNGTGKTTLLKVMAGILPPTEGYVRIEGRVSALLSIQLGMNGELSGYDNIVNRARLMGHSNKSIEDHIDEIAEFSELGEYLALPMKTYSAGMSLRLMFAISTAFEPDILVLDEWLSTGDATFRKKATDRLNGLIQRTRIVIFASHSKDMLRRVCNRGIILQNGRVTFDGTMDDALDRSSEIEN